MHFDAYEFANFAIAQGGIVHPFSSAEGGTIVPTLPRSPSTAFNATPSEDYFGQLTFVFPPSLGVTLVANADSFCEGNGFALENVTPEAIGIPTPDQLHIIGPIPNSILVGGEAGSIIANVQDEFVGLAGQAVVFTKQSGSFTFTSGDVSPDGTQATVLTDVAGTATVMFTGDSPGGDALIEVTVTGAPLSAFAVFSVIDTQQSGMPPAPPLDDEVEPTLPPETGEQPSDTSVAPSGACGLGLGQIMIVSMGARLMVGFRWRRRRTAHRIALSANPWTAADLERESAGGPRDPEVAGHRRAHLHHPGQQAQSGRLRRGR